jgi:peptidyl-prolyl cis-trans isomerase C
MKTIVHRETQTVKPMKTLFKEPLLHFLVIGALIFGLNAWREKTRPTGASTPQIKVTAAVIDRLRAGYERQFGQTPDSEELRGLVTAHIREEVLCREALALGLDRDDTIVRRRLAQKMEFLTDDLVDAAQPEDAAVREFFEKNAAQYAKAGRVSFRHVYFSREKRGATAETAAREALVALEKGASDEAFGDPFLHGFEFVEREQDDVIAAFGAEFAEQLAVQPPGAWHGPVTSSYGLHLVRVEDRKEPRAAVFDDVRATVVRDLNDERRRTANREIFERLRERYRVTVDEAAFAKAAAPAAKLAQQ